jgi:hypothetical protein
MVKWGKSLQSLALLELRLLLGTIGLVWQPMFLSDTEFEISEECEDFTYLPMCFGPRVPQVVCLKQKYYGSTWFEPNGFSHISRPVLADSPKWKLITGGSQGGSWKYV